MSEGPPPNIIDEPGAAAGTRSLRGDMGGGLSWMLVATLVGKVATTVAQILLGWWLLPEHFKTFALATTIAGLVMLSKDGGIPNYLIKQGAEKYEGLSGRAFWLCFGYNMLAAAVMAAVAWPVAVQYGDDKLAPMLWVMALALPLGTPAAVLQAKLRIDLRFKEYSALLSVSIIARQILTIVLAKLGYNELALTLPVVFTALIDSLAAWWVCSDRPWLRAARVREWGSMLSSTKWLINGTVGSFTTEWGPYLVLGRLASEATTGFYYFAYQITAQIGMLLSFNLHIVLMPILTRMNHQPERQAQAFVRVLRGLTLLGSFLSLGVAVIIAPVEQLLWHGKWQPAVVAVIIFGIFYPWRVSFAVTCAVMMAQGRFKRFSLSAWGEGLVLIAATWLACRVKPDDLTYIALSNGVALVITRLIVTAHTFNLTGVPLSKLPGAMISGWLVALAASVPSFGIDSLPMWADLQAILEPKIPAAEEARAVIAMSLVCVLRAGVAGSLFVACFVLLSRLLLAADMREAVGVVPARLRGSVVKLLKL
jgi:O-antigen/teichoic acid export membrane protein